MTTTTIDLSKVPHIEERQRLKVLLEERDRLDQEMEAAIKAHYAAYEAKRQELWAALEPYSAAIAAAREPFRERIAAIDKQIEEIGVEPLLNDDLDTNTYLECALTGLQLLDGDAVLKDEDTGECILRCVLPWPDEEPAAHSGGGEQ